MAPSNQRPVADAWLGAAVLSKTQSGWVHGQVRAIDGAYLSVEHGAGDSIKCRTAVTRRVDPIIVLLLWGHPFPPRTPLSTILAKHAAILNKLLGDAQSRPTRVVSKVLDGVVDAENVPSPSAMRTWLETSGTVHEFTLQHAVDFVYVHESSARRIPTAVRKSIGSDFYLAPRERPTSGRIATPSRRPSSPAPPSRLGKRRASTMDSLYASSVDDALPLEQGSEASDDEDRSDSACALDEHARIAALLRNFPDLLAYHNARPSRTARGTIAQDQDKGSKFAFKPSTAQQRVHATLTNHAHAGMSPSEFVDCLIAHPAVQFAPHPGTLTRLYAFEFGTRGLSIMHLAWLNQLDKIQWTMASATNMQNFSAAVPLPPAATPTSIEDVVAALSSFRTYCVAFASADVVDLVQTMFGFVQQQAGMQLWGRDDTHYLVYWLNGRLEHFRNLAAQDAATASSSRLAVASTISQADPEFQSLVQLVTSQRVLHAIRPTQFLLQPQASMRSSHNASQRRSTYGPSPAPSQLSPRGERSQPARPASRVPSEVSRLIPRQGGRSLCLRSLSVHGCAGAPGRPDECVYGTRGHFVPSSLHADVRALIERQFGGLRAEHQHL